MRKKEGSKEGGRGDRVRKGRDVREGGEKEKKERKGGERREDG
ncbi:hypothetical protein [Escherichia coli]|nr:hypothetical protein [Escherichia coli]